ncbi:hypothetical protein MIND_00206400 [Mycena indigotica]|uniref:Uncharacterized protein n=1 Tax=Mycena indigotica TaxID=2126181 RepID=A0A8H6WGY7_9AGAR|nr:uncharacterized protein MIND_00206400 [Mycena indigotica]KAF7311949.1 hypothetical protein MIND_00206400 [Mycena indigotica]
MSNDETFSVETTDFDYTDEEFTISDSSNSSSNWSSGPAADPTDAIIALRPPTTRIQVLATPAAVSESPGALSSQGVVAGALRNYDLADAKRGKTPPAEIGALDEEGTTAVASITPIQPLAITALDHTATSPDLAAQPEATNSVSSSPGVPTEPPRSVLENQKVVAAQDLAGDANLNDEDEDDIGFALVASSSVPSLSYLLNPTSPAENRTDDEVSDEADQVDALQVCEDASLCQDATDGSLQTQDSLQIESSQPLCLRVCQRRGERI